MKVAVSVSDIRSRTLGAIVRSAPISLLLFPADDLLSFAFQRKTTRAFRT